jgi:hypothetical protein
VHAPHEIQVDLAKPAIVRTNQWICGGHDNYKGTSAALYVTTRRHIPQESTTHGHIWESLKQCNADTSPILIRQIYTRRLLHFSSL